MQLMRKAPWAAVAVLFVGSAISVPVSADEIVSLRLAQMNMKPSMKMEMATEGIFEGVGTVIVLIPEKIQIVVSHDEIKGFMKAMPMGMGYSVEPEALLAGLKPGDRIKFKISAATKKIVEIERLRE